MTDLIDRAKAALEKATPGPWALSEDTCYSGRMSGIYYRVWDDDLNAICSEEYGAHNDGGKENMRLIALAPDLARALIREREAGERLAKVLQDFQRRLFSARQNFTQAAVDAQKRGDFELRTTIQNTALTALDGFPEEKIDASLAAYRAAIKGETEGGTTHDE